VGIVIPQPDLVGNVSKIVHFLHLQIIKCSYQNEKESAFVIFMAGKRHQSRE